MRKIILSCLLTLLIPVANAFIPLPQAVPDEPQEGWMIHGMRASEELRRQELENQMMQERLAMMRRERQMAEMEMMQMREDNTKQQARAKKPQKNVTIKNKEIPQ